MINPPLQVAPAPTRTVIARSRWISAFAVVRTRPIEAICSLLLFGVILIAVFAEFLAPHDPAQNHISDRLVSPGGQYLLGTDNFGRDVLSRIIYGARVSLQVGVFSMIVATTIGTVIGVTTAYFRGPYDFIVGRLIDVVQSLPGIMLLITMLALVGRSEIKIGIVLGLASGIISARVVRGTALSVAAQPFVEVARSVGCTPIRIMFRHILPNIVPVLIVLATINVGSAIVAEASLSFIGYGVPPPAASWGGMLSADGRAFMARAPWLFVAPVVALGVVVFVINLLGDALRDRLDPRLRGR